MLPPAELAPTPLPLRIWWEQVDRAIERKGPEGEKIRRAFCRAFLEVHGNARQKLELVPGRGWVELPPERCTEEYVQAETRRLTDEMGQALGVGPRPC